MTRNTLTYVIKNETGETSRLTQLLSFTRYWSRITFDLRTEVVGPVGQTEVEVQ